MSIQVVEIPVRVKDKPAELQVWINSHAGTLLGPPFTLDGDHRYLLFNNPKPAGAGTYRGGKSRAKNSYKKYMKKTRKRN